jgi:excisionase family DNA binding protein
MDGATTRPVSIGIKTVAEVLGISITTVRKEIADGRLRTFRLGRRVLVRYEDVERLAAEATRTAAKDK